MFNPVSTYRLQFNKSFTFGDLIRNLDYFRMLGVSSFYASPVFEAAPGSMHGYDITNPLSFNSEIGSLKEFLEIHEWRMNNGIGWIQDIVPNHMAYHQMNRLLMDVLEKGRSSKYSRFFDIDFSHPDFEGKIMVPFLGKKLSSAIIDREISLTWNADEFRINYYNLTLPCSFKSVLMLFSWFHEIIPYSFREILIKAENNNNYAVFKKNCGEFSLKENSFREFISNIEESMNNNQLKMQAFLEHQNYKLFYWNEASARLNYRRFFTINGLICLNIDDYTTFNCTHRLIVDLVKEKKINGLRIDHIDGLKKPMYYLENLRDQAGANTYIVSEKILENDEEMPYGLTAQGTSGYDFLGIVNNLFTYNKNFEKFKKFYAELTGITKDIEEIIYEKKKFILENFMKGEWENLTRLFEVSGFFIFGNEYTRESFKNAIGELLICFPVYKIYPEYDSLSASEMSYLEIAFKKALNKNPSLSEQIISIKRIIYSPTGFDEDKKERARDFFLRFLQFTGALMAKGIEDTVMYYYNCFISHNEVGDNPGSFGMTKEKYHELMTRRQKLMPLTLNTTSTHDTKRGEDSRARLNVLSEMADEWPTIVTSWIRINDRLKVKRNGRIIPDLNEEYFIYQALIGAFPENLIPDDYFLSRIDEYIVKALREAKVNSGWNNADEDYENAVKIFAREIIVNNNFLRSFIPFQKRISRFGSINSISQLVLKATSPGVPDFYQGTELPDLSFVDPDNRRQVDYPARFRLLKSLMDNYEKNPEDFIIKLLTDGNNEATKLLVTHILMTFRSAEKVLFRNGIYLPLEVSGKYHSNIIAFARIHEGNWIIVVVPLYLSIISRNLKSHISIKWKDTAVLLPDIRPHSFESVLTGKKLKSAEKLLVSDIMKHPLPAILKGKREKPNRSAGVLLHISSLPGKYGTGDLGNEAFDFADLLSRNRQEYWQVLPFNPVGEDYAFSPYSSASAFAGNIMFISPDKLLASGIVSKRSIESINFKETGRTDFSRAINSRELLCDEAFTNFFCYRRPFSQNEFSRFCDKEKYWLDDYVFFVILKKEFGNIKWSEWPTDFKIRREDCLIEYRKKYENEIRKEYFKQFIFQKQWMSLKEYCNNLGIRLIGDLSFYVNYDSADVWAHPEFFKLTPDLSPEKVSGVPPDYFSEKGQLWNTPVYNWHILKTANYGWWMNRIARNLELCDIIRFDHFRGFSEYWEVNYGEETAMNGNWVAGPGYDFFNRVKEAFPTMPFIAEDLGTIDEKVIRLRDDFGLPGMNVLQFAFGQNTASSAYIPHNFKNNSIVYTGTHDNNTTKGWYREELSDEYRNEVSEYLGHKVSADTCNEDLIRLAYSSVARIAIIPVQDLLGLGAEARLNKPSTSGKNWDWKLRKGELEKIFNSKARKLAALYGRI
ncbi:MAG TPA: malto-oligosyltrehalose synthase [Bacteroidales bacterium]|nr:malto-oligosyltrehalose synthase [Bacteroidales bacterium]